MKNFTVTLFVVILFMSGCASYNSIAPDWAKIETEISESTSESSSSKEEKGKPWWNPLGWF